MIIQIKHKLESCDFSPECMYLITSANYSGVM